MGLAIQMAKAFFESKNLRVNQTDDGKALRIGMGGMKNLQQTEVYVIFDDDDHSAAIRIFGFTQVAPEKYPVMYKVCSEMNKKFRWVKFYVNKDRNSINAEDDAKFEPETCGAEIFELVIRMLQIVDEAYPEFMKALWA